MWYKYSKSKNEFPIVKRLINGLLINQILPTHLSSVFNDKEYITLEGVRELPCSILGDFYSNLDSFDEIKKIKELSYRIKEEKTICPIVILQNGDEFSILDGKDRYSALVYLKHKTFPAIILRKEKEHLSLDSLLKEASSLSDSDIQWWTSYSKGFSFNTENEARQWIKSRLDWFNKQHGSIVGIDKNKNKTTIEQMPLYRYNNKFKIGLKKFLQVKKNTWQGVVIKRNSLEELSTAGFVLAQDVKRISGVEFVKTNSIHETDSNTEYKDNKFIQSLSILIKNKDLDYFKAVVVDQNTMGLIDGHHRLQAVRLAGEKEIPCQFVLFKD